MKFKSALGLLALVGGVSASLTISTNQHRPASNTNTTVVPNTFIVELQPDFHPDVPQPKDRFARTGPGSKPGYHVRQQYDSNDYFFGVSVAFDEEVDLATLRKTAGVKNAWKVAILPRPEPFGLRGAPSAAANSQGELPNLRGTANVNQPLVMGNVQKLHDQGIKGKGVQIAIIDSGVDYRHPALGGGFGRGHKIALGYDLVGDDYTGYNTPVPDADPLATCVDGGHGTHTTGILAMEDPQGQGFGLVGVAPEATIAAYRVFGCEGSSGSDVLISAMLRAAHDGASIISMSVGVYDIWEEVNPYDTVVSALAQRGVAFVSSIGNFGTAGLYSTAAPGLSLDGLSVGSIENDVYPTLYTAHDDQRKAFEYISLFPASLGRVEVYQLGTGLGVPIDANISSGCYQPAWDALAEASVDWNSTVLLVTLISWCGESWGQAADLGVKTLLVSLADDELVVVDEPGDTPQTLYLDTESSQQLVSSLSKLGSGQKYHLTFDGKKPCDAPNPLARTVDAFSSFGPTVEMTLVPKISAPGGTILSTWPLEAGGYAILSGTSMAAPFVAGSLALLRSQQPRLTVAQLFSRLMTTSAPVREYNSTIVSSTARQGAGLINAYAAVKADTAITPSEINLRDSAAPAPQKITITNQSRSKKEYSIQHSPAAFNRVYYDYLSGEQNFYSNQSIIPLEIYASAKFSQSSLTLWPGQSATVQVQITPQEDSWPWSLPVYAGYVKVSTDDATYSIPYIGVPSNRTEVGPIMHGVTTQDPYDSPKVLRVKADDLFLAHATEPTPNMDSYNWSTDASQSFVPLFRADILLPCRFIRFDLVPANTSFVPSLYGFDPKVPIDYQAPPQAILPGFLGVPTYGLVLAITVDDVPDGSSVSSQPYINNFIAQALVLPTLKNDDNVSYNITSGDYRPLVRALRWNGNETNPDDYESWLGPVIRAAIPSDEFPTNS